MRAAGNFVFGALAGIWFESQRVARVALEIDEDSKAIITKGTKATKVSPYVA